MANELEDARARLDAAIKVLRFVRSHLDELHDCGYLSGGKSADGGGRSQRYHFYGDEVGNRRWRATWCALRDWLGLGGKRGRYVELVRIGAALDRLLKDGPPLTAEEYNALVEHGRAEQ